MKLNELYAGFRDPGTIASLARLIAKEAEQLREPLRIMEICGGHTHTIMKYGLNQIIPDQLSFIHGPGCPVCIMPKERIDHAIALASMEDTILVTLADMLKVPGSSSSLAEERARGRDVVGLYSPLDALKIARQAPEKKVVFFAIGFETTTPMTAALVEQTIASRTDNLFFHINHVLVPPAIHAIMAGGETKVNAFIAPSHVSVITGARIYEPISSRYKTPVVVTGFEPVDVMESVLMLVRQSVSGRSDTEIQYTRAVNWEGNTTARRLIDRYFKVRPSFRWRGIGDIPDSALQLRQPYQILDAEKQFGALLPQQAIDDHRLCICRSILRGLATPVQCRVFGRACRPESPMGSCMVSGEGACNAYYRYGRVF